MSDDVYVSVNPTTGSSLVSPWSSEISTAQEQYGYTQLEGAAFAASSKAANGLVPVYRLYNAETTRFTWTVWDSEVTSAQQAGWTNQGPSFYASASRTDSCQVRVVRLLRSGVHRLAVDGSAQQATLLAQGWSVETTAFYAAPASAQSADTEAPVVSEPEAPAAGSAAQTGSPGGGAAGVDGSGTKLPDTNYPIPSGAIFVSPSGSDSNNGTAVSKPVKTLDRAVQLISSTGTVVLRGGTYRQGGLEVYSKNLTFQAYPHESPWIDGSDVVTNWTASGSRWFSSWSTPSFCAGGYYANAPTAQRADNQGPCANKDNATSDAPYELPGDPQNVWVNGTSLRQVKTLAEVTSTSFYYDWSARRLYLGVNPSGRTVEATARANAFVLGNGTYTFKGIGLRRFATNQYSNLTSGALFIGSSVSRIQDSVFTQMSAGALAYDAPKPGSVVDKSAFVQNGFTALLANGSSRNGSRNDLLVQNSLFTGNNAEHFGDNCTVSCASSAVKVAHMVGFTFTSNRIEKTQGVAAGVWCDLDCRDGVIVGNEISDVGNAAILYEVSDTGLIVGNLVVGAKIGISVPSANTKVWNNTLVNISGQGIRVYDDARSRGCNGWTDVGPDTRNVSVSNNVVHNSLGYNLSLIAPPTAPTSCSSKSNTAPASYFASASALDRNLLLSGGRRDPYFAGWTGSVGAAMTYFADRAAFSKAHSYEAHSEWSTAKLADVFSNPAGSDYRLKSGASGRAAPGAALPSDVAKAWGVASGSTPGLGAFATN